MSKKSFSTRKYDDAFFSDWKLKKDHFKKWSHVNSILICGTPTEKIPKVSVCIPVYKGRAAVLKEAIESVLAQKGFTSYEIVVSDNYSPGDTEIESVMKEFCSKHDNILYYRTDYDFGGVANWNRAMELGRAKWAVLLHSDDVMGPDFIRKTYATAVREKATLVSTFRGIFNNNNTTVNSEYVANLSKAQQLLGILRGGRPFHVHPNDMIRFILPSTGCIMYDREKYIEFGGHDDKYEEPADGFCHFSHVYNGNVVIIPEFLYSRRIHGNNYFSGSIVQIKVIYLLFKFGSYYIRTEDEMKNKELGRFLLDVSTAYMVYGIKSKYAPDLDCKEILRKLGISKFIANMPPKLLTLLNSALLLDLIFRK